MLGVCLTVCFVTGVVSHYHYHPWEWLPPPATPRWGYRLTQGLHVITGFACIPLVLAKLWSVRPRLTQMPPIRSVPHGLARLGVAILVAVVLLQLVTGFLNVLQWYPWPWPFVAVHHALAWILFGAMLIHIAVQLPNIRAGLAETIGRRWTDGRGLTRRGALAATGIATGAVAITTAGQVVGPLAPAALLAARRPDQAPDQGLPVNGRAGRRTAALVQSEGFTIELRGRTRDALSVPALEGLPRQIRVLPMACVEGWSRDAEWAGPPLLEVIARVGGTPDSVVTVRSPDRVSTIRAGQLAGALLATHLNGERLSLDHGYPVRLIAPGRIGVHQTKWITRIEVR